MKSLIIYLSLSNGNTKKIAEVISKKLNAKLVNTDEAKKINLLDYDLIGFGSGIFYSKHHKILIDFVRNLKNLTNKKVFIFSTSGIRRIKFIYDFHKQLRREILKKNIDIVGEFNCLGYDTWYPLKIIGGINKKRPNQKDLVRAKIFAETLINKF